MTNREIPTRLVLSGGILIISNIIPLAGVLFFHWELIDILLLYWLESAIIGFFNIFRLVMVEARTSMLMVPFFTMHYGIFMFGHFFFIVLINYLPNPQASVPFEIVMNDLRLFVLPRLYLPFLAIFFSHGYSFITNFIGNKEYRLSKTSDLMSAPYKRVIIMQFALIAGSFSFVAFNRPAYTLLILIVLKIIIDLTTHLKEHSKSHPAASGR